MSGQNTQSRTVLPMMLVVFGIVLIWWLWIWPHTSMSKAHRREAELKGKLRSITPPPGTSIDIYIIPFGDDVLVNGSYVSDLDCEPIKKYYTQEFPKHGFAYKGITKSSGTEISSMLFAGPEYDASFYCLESNTPRHAYNITLSRKNVLTFNIDPQTVPIPGVRP